MESVIMQLTLAVLSACYWLCTGASTEPTLETTSEPSISEYNGNTEPLLTTETQIMPLFLRVRVKRSWARD